jgi:hypothetical protein
MKNHLHLLFLATIIATVGLMYPNQVAYACTCAPLGTAQEELANSDYVFQGRVTTVIPIGLSSYSVSFDIVKVWKGIGYKSMTLKEMYCPIYPAFSRMGVGKEYIIYAQGEVPDLTFGMCSRIRESQYINNEVKELGEGSRPTVNYPIYLRQDYLIYCLLSISIILVLIVSALHIKKKKHVQNRS